MRDNIFAGHPHKPSAPSSDGQPEAGELAWSDGLFFGRVPMERWNPDDLIWHRGYAAYRKMLTDDQVRSLVDLRRAMVTARGWHFEMGRQDGAQQQCADFFRFMITQRLEGTFSQLLSEMMTSQIYGFSIVEKIAAPVEWEGKTYWGVARMKLRPAESFSFETDVHGNLTGLLQVQGTAKVSLPPGKFIHHVNRPDMHALFGESDLRACYRHWWAKDNLLKFWNIYLERMAAGFVHGRITGPLTPAERDELKRVMRNLSAQTSIITPGSVELQMVQAKSTNAFELAVAARDRAIAKALLVPNLLGFSEQGNVGSFSQSRTQMEAFLLVVNSIAESLADTLNEQLFRELARWNFGLHDGPRFVFDPLTDDQKREFAQAWRDAVTAGVVQSTGADETRTRELLRYPDAPHPQRAKAE